MPVTGFAEDDLFVIRLFKSHTNNPDRVWANNYEFQAKNAGDEGDIASLLLTMLNFERHFHTTTTHFIRSSCSTWAPDSVPYDPAAFVSIPLNDFGQRTDVAQVVAVNQCLRVNRIPAAGRFGNVFYRNALFESEVEAPSGISVLTSGADILTAFPDAVELDDLVSILGGDDPTWRMVMVNADGTVVRAVHGLLPAGVSTVPTNHTWFNRSSITVP